MSLLVDGEKVMEMDASADPIQGKPAVRYIKLGANNAWAEQAFANDEIPLSFREVPHEVALTGDEARIATCFLDLGKSRGAATSAARQVRAFYELGNDTIWITFANGLMYWTQAVSEVIWLGETDNYAPRVRRASGWACCNKFNVPFSMSNLSSRLTKVAGTQSTLCRVEAEDYVLRKIFNYPEPVVVEARRAEGEMLKAIEHLVAELHWSDFETLVDLLLARSGWHRISGLGEDMKDADLIAEQAVTKERVFVQVKSASDQKELDRYIEIFGKNPDWARMIFACHSPSGTLNSPCSDVMVWSRLELARMALRNGLFDWLVDRVA